MEMNDLPLFTLQQHNTYGIMDEHVNACSWYQSKKQAWNPNLNMW